MKNCVYLHIVCVKLLAGDTRSLHGMGVSFLAGRAEEDVLFGHSNIMKEAGSNRISLVYRYAMSIKPSCDKECITCRLEAVGSDVAGLAVMGDVYCRDKSLGDNDVSPKINQIIEQRIIHED